MHRLDQRSALKLADALCKHISRLVSCLLILDTDLVDYFRDASNHQRNQRSLIRPKCSFLEPSQPNSQNNGLLKMVPNEIFHLIILSRGKVLALYRNPSANFSLINLVRYFLLGTSWLCFCINYIKTFCGLYDLICMLITGHFNKHSMGSHGMFELLLILFISLMSISCRSGSRN